ncbi:MAG: hypothetical protein M0Z52_03040 [Actinomycetota bacterium]|nr:hypothetical protein [Actinomycetota bacterium]
MIGTVEKAGLDGKWAFTSSDELITVLKAPDKPRPQPPDSNTDFSGRKMP